MYQDRSLNYTTDFVKAHIIQNIVSTQQIEEELQRATTLLGTTIVLAHRADVTSF